MLVRTITASILVLFGTVVVAHLGTRLFGGEEPADEYACHKLVFSRYVAIGYCFGSLVAFHRMFPPWESVIEFLPEVVHVPVAALTTATSVVLAAAIGLIGIDRAYRPALERYDTFAAANRTRIRRQKRRLLLVTLFGFALVVELTLSELVADRSFLILPGSVALLCGYWHFANQIDPKGWTHVRDPTADERALIERCYDRLGRTSGRTYVFSPLDRLPSGVGANSVTTRSVPGSNGPTLWIEDTVLESVSEDELAVSIAQADELARRNETAYATLGHVTLGAGLLTVGWLLFAHQSIPLAVGLLAIMVLATVACYRRVGTHTFAADDTVSARFGVDTVLEVYEDRGHLLEDSVLVSIDDRIARLEEQPADDANEATETNRTASEPPIDGQSPE